MQPKEKPATFTFGKVLCAIVEFGEKNSFCVLISVATVELIGAALSTNDLSSPSRPTRYPRGRRLGLRCLAVDGRHGVVAADAWATTTIAAAVDDGELRAEGDAHARMVTEGGRRRSTSSQVKKVQG